MPSSSAPEVIIARFLKSNQYNETLKAFLVEAGLPPDAGTTGPGDWTIEKIIEEKRQYEASLVYEKIDGKDGKVRGWGVPAPSKSDPIDSLDSSCIAVHITHSATPWASPPGDTVQLLVSSTDRKIFVLSTKPGHRLRKIIDLSETHNSPVLSIASVSRNVFLTSSMSGNVDLYGADYHCLESGRHHAKYAVQVTTTESRFEGQNGKPFCIAASAGWDQKICIYSFEPSSEIQSTSDASARSTDGTQISSPKASITVPTNPESILFVRHPDTAELYLVVGRRDSTYLYYFKVTEEMAPEESSNHLHLTMQQAGSQNLAPYANAWISFSPSSLASHPTDPTLIAIATSHIPHMKLILVRLLFPDPQAQGGEGGFVRGETQAAQARAELAIQDREDAAIMLHVSTMAPQTPYSTPQVVWRPDGSGVWVNGDDGVVRGLEARTGKVVTSLKGHEVGSKVRTLWSGIVKVQEDGTEEEEWLVSAGFDKRVIIWKPGKSEP